MTIRHWTPIRTTVTGASQDYARSGTVLTRIWAWLLDRSGIGLQPAWVIRRLSSRLHRYRFGQWDGGRSKHDRTPHFARCHRRLTCCRVHGDVARCL